LLNRIRRDVGTEDTEQIRREKKGGVGGSTWVVGEKKRKKKEKINKGVYYVDGGEKKEK
jgi:hypothetical protein